MPTDPTDADLPADEDLPGAEEEFIDRRSGKDRRGRHDRRRGGRRHRRVPIGGEDRRGGGDRRHESRRHLTDRRMFQDPRYKKPRKKKEAGSVYSVADVDRIQHMLSRVGFGARCPVCEGAFTLGPLDRRGAESVRQVSCADCGRSTVVRNCVLVRVMVLTRVEAIRRTLRGILGGAGHEAVEPPHAVAALEIQRENPADVVVVDATALAEMDGQEFIRRLRQEFPDQKIVVLAPRPSYGRADPSAAAMRLGATHVVRTPFTRDDILRVLKESRP